jgi:tetratricopeptide (TPR) repeat protein
VNRLIALVALISIFVTPARAQDDPHAACAAPPSYVPAELLERAVPLRSGVGNSHEVVTTTSKDAQAFYNQGLNYLESYVWIEASRSFHQALRFDPNLAMAYIGLSRTHSGLDDPESAVEYFEKAKALSAKASDRERRRIAIREAQLAALENIDDMAKLQAYRKTIDDALAIDLDDPQLWLMAGNATETNASGRGQRGTAASVAYYDRVLLLVPDHASAHHYLIHSYETIGQIEMALKHGAVFARESPSIPHAAHMWGHDLRRVGRVDDAIVQFKKANSLELAYYKSENIDPALDWHHSHNLDLLATCYQHKGQMKVAETTMRQAAELEVVDAYRAFNMRILPNFLIHRARYEEALQAAWEMTKMAYPQARTVGHALATQALIGLGRVPEAELELVKAQTELETVPVATIGLAPKRSMVQGWVDAARGELLLETQQTAEANTVLKEAQKALRAMIGPDAWTQTLFRLETMARSAREVGDWSLAEYTAKQMLDHDAAYGGSHLAYALVLEHQGQAAEARKELEKAKSLWRDADPDLPELKQIATVLASTR